MITFILALIGLGMSIVGIGILLYRHWPHENMEGTGGELFFEEFFATLKMRGILFWQTNLRDSLLHESEKALGWCEDVFKRIAAFLRLMRSRVRRRQLNGVNQEDRYWHHLNSWNARRLKLRLRRKKTAEEE